MAKPNFSKKREVSPSNTEAQSVLSHYQDRAIELVEKKLIKPEDKELVFKAKSPDEAKITLLAALEERHKEAREAYLKQARDERKDQIDSGIA